MSFVALSGLPRTGSTVLSSILAQNPDVHAEGHSGVCQFMWDMHVSCESGWGRKALAAALRDETQHDLVSAIPGIYYKNVTAQHIVDKSRSWTLPDNVELIRRYIRRDPKILVLTRPVEEIVRSFHNLRARNGLPPGNDDEMWLPDTEPLTRPLAGVEYARAVNQGEYHFIEYAHFMSEPKEVIEGIYEFCEWEPFEHWFDGIEKSHPEDESVWDIPNLHEVRSTLSAR